MADFVNLNALLAQIDWDTVTDESDFDELPEGFYLCEVEKAELKDNKAQTNRQVSFQFKVVENGLCEGIDANGYSTLVELPNTKNRKIFKHYPFKDIAGIKRFVTDMMKFEGDTPGEPLLDKEYFMTEEVIPDALEILCGMRIYVQITQKEYQGKTSSWYNIIAWNRAKEMSLPM